MATLSNLKRRIAKLRTKSAKGKAVLHFANGSTRAVQLRNQLGIAVAAMRRRSRELENAEDEPAPVSKYDSAIDLLRNADHFENEAEPFLHLVLELCQESPQQGARQ